MTTRKTRELSKTMTRREMKARMMRARKEKTTTRTTKERKKKKKQQRNDELLFLHMYLIYIMN